MSLKGLLAVITSILLGGNSATIATQSIPMSTTLATGVNEHTAQVRLSAEHEPALKIQPPSKDNALDKLIDQKTYDGLPVGKIENFPVKNAIGTVVLLPQSHRYPGSTPEDPINDGAEIVQNEIYSILNRVISVTPLRLVVAEGDPAGPVDQTKLNSLAEKEKRIDAFKTAAKEVLADIEREPLANLTLETLENDIVGLENKLDRQMLLEGAPYKLKADGKNVALYGAEVPSTVEKSKVLVRNYIYLQDRLAQLDVPKSATKNSDLAQSLGLSDIVRLLGTPPSPEQRIAQSIKKMLLTARSAHNDSLSSKLIQLQSTVDDLTKPIEATLTLPDATPSRSDNPYASITSKTAIQKLIKENDEQINAVVIDTRNEEAAASVRQAMDAENEKAAVLQYGAGHEEGLVKELNTQGLSVIVITSRTLLDTNNKK